MRTSARLLTLALILSAIMAVPAFASAAEVVKARNNDTWTPTPLVIGKGQKVVFKNPTAVDHDVVQASTNWTINEILNPGDRTRYTFKKKGIFKYVCTLHTGMIGRVKVVSAG